MTDKEYMQIAIDISKKAMFPYGAIIVKDDKIIGRSDAVINNSDKLYTHSGYRAIQNAIENGYAGSRIGDLYGGLENATIYTSCQPCMICMGVILYKKISKIVYAARLEDSSKYVVQEIEASVKQLSNLANEKVEVVEDLLRAEAVKVLKNWSRKNKDKY